MSLAQFFVKYYHKDNLNLCIKSKPIMLKADATVYSVSSDRCSELPFIFTIESALQYLSEAQFLLEAQIIFETV